MKRADLVAGGIYAFKATYRDPAMVLTTDLVERTRPTGRGAYTYRVAPPSAKIATSNWGHRDVGVLVLRGRGEHLEEINAAGALAEVLEGGKCAAVVHVELIFSLGLLTGPWREISAARDTAEQQRRDADREKNREYTEVAQRINRYLPDSRKLTIHRDSGWVWGTQTPSTTLYIHDLEALADGIEAAIQERAKLAHDIRDGAFAAMIESGELSWNPDFVSPDVED